MHRFWFILVSLVLLLTVMPLAACDDDEENEGTMASITSSQPASSESENTSRETTPETSNDEPAKTQMRIISLAPSNTEILFALGLEDQVVGVTEYCNYPEAATKKPKVGGFSTVDMEKVIELDPDLILATNIHKETVVPALEDLGLKVITLDPKTLDDVLNNIALVGAETGKEEEASLLINEMKARIEAITTKVTSLTEEEKPRFLAIAWHDPIYAASPKNLQGSMIAMAGGINIAYDIDTEPMGLEAVIDRNPQVIIAYTGHGEGEQLPFEWAKTEPRLNDTDAAKNGRIYQIDADLIGRGGPRIVDAFEQVAQFLHPEIFGAPASEAAL